MLWIESNPQPPWIKLLKEAKMLWSTLTFGGNHCCRERVKQRLALYQGVIPIHMQFSDDAEETFTRAISSLLVRPCARKLHCWAFVVIIHQAILALMLHISVVIEFYLVLLEFYLLYFIFADSWSECQTESATCEEGGLRHPCPERSDFHLERWIHSPHPSEESSGLKCRSGLILGEFWIALPRSVIILLQVIFNVLRGDCYVELHFVFRSHM